jgi:YbbR domain-containing protein
MIQWLTRDWGLKLISLALAVGLWYYAIGEESIEITRTIPLEIKLKNEKMSILKTSVDYVQATLSAPRSLLSDLTSGEIRAVHEIGSEVKTAGDYSFRLESREIKLPAPQIRVTDIMPEAIAVTVDELIVQKLKIKPNFVGEPAIGYKVKETRIQMDPNAILVEGPKGQLENLEAIKTEPIDLVGRVRSVRRTVLLNIPSNLKPLSEAVVDIYIPIEEEFDEKRFENIPIKILKSSQRDVKVELNPSVISFVVKGPRRQLEGLLPEKILVYIDISALQPGTHDISISLILPPDVSLKEEEPLTVKTTIRK